MLVATKLHANIPRYTFMSAQFKIVYHLQIFKFACFEMHATTNHHQQQQQLHEYLSHIELRSFKLSLVSSKVSVAWRSKQAKGSRAN